MNNTYSKMLSSAEIERQVEDAYNGMLKDAFPGIEISYPYSCDGYFEADASGKQLKAICEFKYELNLSSKSERSKILAQVLFYLKRFEDDARQLPNVVFIGDRNECFCLHTNSILKFLDFEGVDWSKAPSHASDNAELVLALASDEDRNAFVWKIDGGFDFNDVAAQMKSLATGVTRQIHVTEHNVDRVFSMFRDRVLKDAKKIQPNDLVGLFYGCVCEPESNYLHPAKKNALVSGGREYRADSSAFKAFRSIFEYVKSPSQKKHLAAISDRLIEDTNRRRKGEFFTPTVWADYSQQIIAKRFGENWRDEYVVIDCACGTKNLTRDYQFKELYCSTLEQAELDISRNYNPEAVSFQFDFLNDSLEDLEKKAPGLVKAFKENRKIIWYFNPPYAKVGKSADGVGNCGVTAGAGKTKINELMLNAKIGACSSNLLAQFLYRIMVIKQQFKLTNCNLAFFCNPVYLSSSHFEKFRKKFLKEFKFENGILFNAGHFAGTSSNWGINFSIMTSGETADKNHFQHILTDLDENNNVIEIGIKNIYNLDYKNVLSDWIREPVKNIATDKNHLPVTSAIKIAAGKVWNSLFQGNLGYFYTHGNNVQKNATDNSMFSTVFSAAGGCGLNADNFSRCCSAFAARRLVACDWINNQDQYMKPNVEDPRYKEFETDALVYSLFESKSQQSSLRKVEYKGKTWDVKNEFFWMTAKEMAELADAEGLDETYNEASTSPDRHMAKLLSAAKLSDEAKAVLEKAKELVRKSMKYRRLFDEDNPNYQILNWDAGWYQIKAVLKAYMPKELEEFKTLYKKLGDKMRPMVYSLGFLKK